MNNYAIMHRSTVDALMNKMLPMHYSILYDTVRSDDGVIYSHPTEPHNNRAAEKYRQYYSEHYRESVCFINGGYLAMRYWFPQKEMQARLLYVEEYQLPVSFKLTTSAAHEYMQRAKHMIDYNNDRDTLQRTEKSIAAYITEFAIKDYFKGKYPNNFKDASNNGDYKRPAWDDFSICINESQYKIDIKSVDFVRHDRPGMCYVRGDFYDSQSLVAIVGWLPSRMIKIKPFPKWRHIDSLVVYFNCLINGIDYNWVVNGIKDP